MADNIIEEREEAMISPCGGNSFIRIAHFLKPTETLSKPKIFDVRKTPLHVFFSSSTTPLEGWSNWVNLLLPKYKVIWKQAGIYDSILASTVKINMHQNLVLALAERWCDETNTFVFPWGETTITLEDMVVLGGYSVLGDSVFSPLDTCENVVKIDEELVKAYILMGSACTRQIAWMNHFKNTDTKIEHEAFLALWLSRYAFPSRDGCISRCVFPIAIHLSRGICLTIAPAILATLYKDLSLLKNTIVSSPKGQRSKLRTHGPLQLLQVWAWERFPALRPNPNLIRDGDPRLARWHELKELKVKNLREAIDCSGEDFQWRPYCTIVNNWRFNEFYREHEEWVVVGPVMGKDIETFAICVRPSELVGSNGCIVQYQPHRVAMQFGFDQDVPGFVPRFNDCFESAWSNYTRPIGDTRLYIPARLFESDVTLRYFTWWDGKMFVKKDMIKEIVRNSPSERRKKVPKPRWTLNCEDKPACIPFVDDDDNLKTMEVIKKAKVDRTDGSSSNTEKELKNNRELELEARVCELEARVHELEGLIKQTTERLGLIEELSSCRRSVGCSCMI